MYINKAMMSKTPTIVQINPERGMVSPFQR